MTLRVDGGFFLFTGMFLVFLVLKLCGVIAWSWWWVTLPLWGPIGFIGLFFVPFLFWIASVNKVTKVNK